MSELRDPVRWLDAQSDCDPALRRVLDSARRGLPDGAHADTLATAIEQAVRGPAAIGGEVERALRLRWWLAGAGIAGVLLWIAAGMLSSRAGPELTTSSSVAASSEVGTAPPRVNTVQARVDAGATTFGAAPGVPAARAGEPVVPQIADVAPRRVSAETSATPRPERPRKPRVRAREPVRRVAPEPAASVAASTAAGAPEQTDVAPELQLLSAAQRALRVDPAEALALAEQHARAYAAGRFVEEREEIAIAALIALGEQERAGARARAFLARYPGSLAAARIERLLERSR